MRSRPKGRPLRLSLTSSGYASDSFASSYTSSYASNLRPSRRHGAQRHHLQQEPPRWEVHRLKEES